MPKHGYLSHCPDIFTSSLSSLALWSKRYGIPLNSEAFTVSGDSSQIWHLLCFAENVNLRIVQINIFNFKAPSVAQILTVPVSIKIWAKWEVCLVRSGYFHLQTGWFSYRFASPWRGCCFHKTSPQRGNRESSSDAISSAAKLKYHFCLCPCDFATDQTDKANVSKVITMENYLSTAPINKKNCFKLSGLRYLGANLAFFNFTQALTWIRGTCLWAVAMEIWTMKSDHRFWCDGILFMGSFSVFLVFLLWLCLYCWTLIEVYVILFFSFFGGNGEINTHISW